MNTPDSKQEALLPLTTYKNKRVASDNERFRLNSELNTYLFNNCDHEHDGYPNHLACRPCVLDCLAFIASRASVAAVQGDAALVQQIVEAVWRNVKRYEDGEIWMDTLRAKAQVKKLLTPAAASSSAPAEKLTPLQQAMAEHDDDMARLDRNTLPAEPLQPTGEQESKL